MGDWAGAVWDKAREKSSFKKHLGGKNQLDVVVDVQEWGGKVPRTTPQVLLLYERRYKTWSRGVISGKIMGLIIGEDHGIIFETTEWHC